MSILNEKDYKPIPVHVARDISNQYAKSMVIILAWDAIYEKTHSVSFGVEPNEKKNAARIADQCIELIYGGKSEKEEYQDYRFIKDGERAKLVDGLINACKAADHAIASIMAGREGMTDAALQSIRDEIKKAIEKV